jgi:hypothetical protein
MLPIDKHCSFYKPLCKLRPTVTEVFETVWHGFKAIKGLVGTLGELDHHIGVQSPARGLKIRPFPYSTFEKDLRNLSFVSGFDPAHAAPGYHGRLNTQLLIRWSGQQQ